MTATLKVALTFSKPGRVGLQLLASQSTKATFRGVAATICANSFGRQISLTCRRHVGSSSARVCCCCWRWWFCDVEGSRQRRCRSAICGQLQYSNAADLSDQHWRFTLVDAFLIYQYSIEYRYWGIHSDQHTGNQNRTYIHRSVYIRRGREAVHWELGIPPPQYSCDMSESINTIEAYLKQANLKLDKILFELDSRLDKCVDDMQIPPEERCTYENINSIRQHLDEFQARIGNLQCQRDELTHFYNEKIAILENKMLTLQ